MSSTPEPQIPYASKAENVRPIRFTQEELKVIKDCNRESFYKRCIPISTVLGISTYYGVKLGYLKPSAKLGATPKVIVAGIIGYFIGKISYQTKCAERLMQLPNSAIGEVLRQRRRGNLRESLDSGFGPGLSLAPFGNISATETYSDIDAAPSRSLDVDTTTTPQFEGLDESFRPSLDNPIYEEEMPPVQKHVTTYEELRKQNREEYQQKRTGNYKDTAAPATSPLYNGHTTKSSPDVSIGKNKYGDDME